ncbi:MAG: fructose-bisphosphatase class III, partial [Lachnospiraceae bacterium]|nr:fructose-bisphosphatase class III [Lachnospiraceae bacterium]
MSTYVISDMHGRMDLFLKMLEKIGFSENDHLYCLGDAADRGPKGIEILLLLMQMDNVTYICGNHDLMFTKAVRRAVQMGYSEKVLNTEEFQLWMLNGGASTWNRYIELERSVRREILAYIGNSYLLIPQLKVGEHYFYLCPATHAERPILEPLLLKNADRQTIEQTFEALLKFIAEMSEEEERAVWEGLDEETLAIYDLLKKPALSKSEA